MPRFAALFLLLICLPALAQAPPAAGSREQMKRAEDTPETAAVVTIRNFCKPPAKRPCRTVLSKQEFEAIVVAMNPNMPPDARARIAHLYAHTMAKAEMAKRRGLERSPLVQRQLEMARLRILEQALERELQTQAADIKHHELLLYYQQNPAAYEELALRRLYLPRTLPGYTGEQAQKAALDLASQARERLARGDDADTVQRELFAAAKIESAAPGTDIGSKRRGSLPAAHESEVFTLKQGEVSGVISDPGALFLYRVESRRVLPFEQVQDDIRRTMQTQRFRDALAKIEGSIEVELNPEYFGNVAPPAPARGNRGPEQPLVTPKPKQEPR